MIWSVLLPALVVIYLVVLVGLVTIFKKTGYYEN